MDKHAATREPHRSHGDDLMASEQDHGQASSLYNEFSSDSHDVHHDHGHGYAHDAHADQCMACAVLRCVCHPLTVLGLMAMTLLFSILWGGGDGLDRGTAMSEQKFPNQGLWWDDCDGCATTTQMVSSDASLMTAAGVYATVCLIQQLPSLGTNGKAVYASRLGRRKFSLAIPIPTVDCQECHHLPSDPAIYGHFGGLSCPCLADGDVSKLEVYLPQLGIK
jgi:hypothetical protein